jgi:hypothetical protein
MSETVPRVESKGGSENGLSSVLSSIGKTTDELDNMCTVEGAGCNEIGERESVQDWALRNG